jgi:hypothetical protein
LFYSTALHRKTWNWAFITEKAQSSYDENKIPKNCIFSEGSKNLPEDHKSVLVMSDDLTPVWSCGSQI